MHSNTTPRAAHPRSFSSSKVGRGFAGLRFDAASLFSFDGCTRSRLLDVSLAQFRRSRSGACRAGGAGLRTHRKGCGHHWLLQPFFSAYRDRLGNRLASEFFQWRHPMENRELPLLGRIDGPHAVPMQVVSQCKSYRDAVRVAWSMRRIPAMTKAMLAHFGELTPQHISDYLAEDDNPGRRDLPADAIARFENVVGNTLVSQWVARQSQLTVLEEMQATRAAA